VRLALLSDGRSGHTRRWAEYFGGCGDALCLITLEAPRDMPEPVHRLGPKLPLDWLSYSLAVPRARAILRDFAPDLVNAHFLPNYGWMALHLGLRPWVLSTWGSDVLVNPQRSALHRWRARRVLRAADLVTSDAAMLSDAARALAGQDLPLLTAPMGVDADWLAVGVGAGEREPVVFHDRNLEPVYDLPTVLRGLAGFFPLFPEWRARLAGEGSQARELQLLARRLGIAERVSFLGRLDRDGLMAELGRAELYLSASLSDSTSVSLLEAMAAGAYPVLSDIPANREWIPAPPEAQYFACGDAADLSRALCAALALPAAARTAAREHNRGVIAERALWRDNMARVREAFLALVEDRP
jgi:glycosyltransferase involved in cell wall biosynthesis